MNAAQPKLYSLDRPKQLLADARKIVEKADTMSARDWQRVTARVPGWQKLLFLAGSEKRLAEAWKALPECTGREGAKPKYPTTGKQTPEQKAFADSVMEMLGEKEMYAREIAEVLGVDTKRVSHALSKARMRGDVVTKRGEGQTLIWKKVEKSLEQNVRKV